MPLLSYSFPCFLLTSPLLLQQRVSPPFLFSLYLLTARAVPSLHTARFFTTGPRPRALQKEDDPGSPASVRPGPVSNLIIRRLIIHWRDENYASTIIFSREFSFPVTDDLTQHSITRLVQILRISRDDGVVPYFTLMHYPGEHFYRV